MPKTVPLVGAALMVTLHGVAIADSASATQGPDVRISGFGTLGVVQTDTKLAEYANYVLRRGASRDPSLEPDSKLGIQLDLRGNERLSATLQAQTRATAQGHWNPAMSLAFANLRVAGDLDARAGRLAGPFFLVSDYRSVGYSMLWARPPGDVYGQIPFESFDGADLLFRGDLGSASILGQVFGGATQADVRESRIRAKQMLGLNAAIQWNELTFRLGHASARITVRDDDVAALVQGLRGLSAIPLPQFARTGAAADFLVTEGARVGFSGIGLTYEGSRLAATAELTRRTGQGVVPRTTGGYVSLGYRFGRWTPFVLSSRLQHSTSGLVSAVPSIAELGPAASALDPAVLGALPGLDAGLKRALSSVGQRSDAVGLRWDPMRNLSLKAQYERIRIEASPTFAGLFAKEQPGFGARPVQAYSLVADFVF